MQEVGLTLRPPFGKETLVSLSPNPSANPHPTPIMVIIVKKVPPAMNAAILGFLKSPIVKYAGLGYRKFEIL